MFNDPQFLTTTEAARELGCSRQHVVNLCERGELPFTRVGRHRRIRRDDLAPRHAAADPHRRQRLRSLWLHRAVAGKLAADPEPVLAVGRRNLERHRAVHPRGRPWLDAWASLLEDPEATLEVLTSPGDRAAELRVNSPFAGVLNPDERDRILASFDRWWQSRSSA